MTTEAEIKSAIYEWFTSSIGEHHEITITFDSDLITGNSINATINTEVMAQVDFITDHDTTMTALATALQNMSSIISAEVTDNREITCIGREPGVTLSVTGPTVTGGVSQSLAEVNTVTDPSNVTVIFANQNAPRPAKPYGTILIMSVIRVGQNDEQRETDNYGEMALVGQRQMTVSLNIYGEGAIDYMETLQQSLSKFSVLQNYFGSAPISILNKSTIQNLTYLLETDFESRAQMDITIGYAVDYTDDVGLIEHVEVVGTVNDEELINDIIDI